MSASGELRSRPPWLLLRWFALGGFLLVAGAVGYFGYQQFAGEDGTPPAGTASVTAAAVTKVATAATTPSATAAVATTTVAALVLKKGGNAIVINSPDKPVRSCLQVRASAARSAQLLFDMCNGEKVKIVDGTGEKSADGIVWWSVQKEAGGQVGWSAEGDPNTSEKWLQPVP